MKKYDVNKLREKLERCKNVSFDDIIYMMGGNTIYLLDMVRKYNFGEVIKKI